MPTFQPCWGLKATRNHKDKETNRKFDDPNDKGFQLTANNSYVYKNETIYDIFSKQGSNNTFFQYICH